MSQSAKKLSAEELAKVRRTAVLRVQKGESAAEVTRSYGLAPKTIYRWLQTANEQGLNALDPIPRTGRNRLLTAEEELKVYETVMASYPYQYDLEGSIWTKQTISDLVLDHHQVSLSGSSILRMLERFGLAPRQLKADLLEDSSNACERWLKRDYVKIRQHATNKNAEIFWFDIIPMKKDFFIKPVDTKIRKKTTKKVATLFTLKGKFCCLPFMREYKPQHFLKLLKTIMRDRERPIYIICKPEHYIESDALRNYLHLFRDYIRIIELPE